jgi:hypothetical protein
VHTFNGIDIVPNFPLGLLNLAQPLLLERLADGQLEKNNWQHSFGLWPVTQFKNVTLRGIIKQNKM